MRRAILTTFALTSACYSGVEPARGVDDAPTRVTPDEGEDDGADDGDGPVADCEGAFVGRTPLRRMTREQYDHTIRDLLGIDSHPAASLESDERIGPFYSNAVAPVAALTVEQYMQVAETLAEQATANLATILPCDPIDGEAECAAAFIAAFVPRAYRRPITEAERARYLAIYDLGREDGTFAEGIGLVIQTALQSPFFLYHVERDGTPVPDREDVVAVDDHELASRLSYFLWGSMPDDTLFAAAAGGELQTREGVRTQAERMLEDPRAAEAIASFHLQWFGVAEVGALEKDGELFPAFDDALVQAMRDETARFVNYVLYEDDAKLATLFTAPYSLPDPLVASIYGIALPPEHPGDEPVDLDPSQRAGLLTQPSVLATHAHHNQTSPVSRGVFVRENLLCQPLPPPPPDVDNTPPAPDPNATTRERFDQHKSDPVCAGCHALIDDIGLGFENYDALGVFRATENGKPVDASGAIVGTEDIDGPFVGAVELGAKLGSSAEVQACAVQQWFRFALGRTASEDDACVLQGLADDFVAADGDVRQLMIAIATSDSFRYRRMQ